MNLRALIRESLTPKAETLTRDQLRDIAREDHLNGGKRFNEFDRGGVFKYFFSHDIGYDKYEMYFPTVKLGDEVVGIAKLQKDPHKPNSSWISYVTIDPKYQGLGCAAPLIDELFRFAKSQGWEVQGSGRSQMGQERLPHLIDRYSKAHGVTYIPSKDTFGYP